MTGEWTYIWDSFHALHVLHLFFDGILNQGIPLWAPEINGGEPLWITLENFPVWDPIAGIFWGIGLLLGKSSILSFQWTCVTWLLVFSLGGACLSRRIFQNLWIQTAVFIVLSVGATAESLPLHSPGVLLPFRYLPWVLELALRLEEKPTIRRAALLGMVAALSLSGYQSVFSIFFIGVFLGSHWIFGVLLGPGNPLRHLKYYPIALGTGLVLAAPTLIACFELLNMFPIARHYSSAFVIPYRVAWRGVLGTSHYSHGNVYLGMVLPVFVVLGLLLIGLNSIRRRIPTTPQELGWVVTAVIAIGLATGPHSEYPRVFLGLRNWGFSITVVQLALTLLSVVGIRYLVEWFGLSGRTKTWVTFLIFAVTAINVSGHMKAHAYHGVLEARLWARLPALKAEGYRFSEHREWEFDCGVVAPFHIFGPAVHHRPFAVLPPLCDKPTYPVGMQTHLLRLPRYHALVSSDLRESTKKHVLGVSRPVVESLSAVIPTPTLDAALQKLRSLPDDEILQAMGTVEGPLPGFLDTVDQWKPLPPANATWNVVSYRPRRVTFQVRMESNGLFVYKDSFAKGWRVKVDGKPKRLLIANGLSKSVALPKGTHEVTFVYRPTLYLLGWYARLVGWVVICLAGLGCLLRRVRSVIWPSRSFIGPSTRG